MTPIPETIAQCELPTVQALRGQRITFNPGSWMRSFHRGPMAAVLVKHSDGVVTRGDMLDAAGAAAAEGWADTAVARAAATTMLWGIGKGNAGRGFSWAHNLLEDPAFTSKMAPVIASMDARDPAQAYKHARQLSGIREPFFTKLLYSFGHAAGCAPTPLVLDDRVRAALKKAGYVYGRRYQRKGEQYLGWLLDMQAWADERGCRADQIEMALFVG